MPPSGFHKEQSFHVVSFLRLCLSDLASEAKELSLKHTDALKKEVNNIDLIVQNDDNKYQFHILMIVREFYLNILKSNPSDEEEMISVGEDICSDINELILSVHVPKITI